MSAKRESPDILYLIEARLDSGRSKGAPQLNKDIRVLQKAAAEIERLRAEVAELEAMLPSALKEKLRCAEDRIAELEQQPAGWRLVEKPRFYALHCGNEVIATLTGPDAETNAAAIARAIDEFREQQPRAAAPDGWTTTKPSVEGAYMVRGWDGAKTHALVAIHKDGDGELRCNLHERNSDTSIDRWCFVDELAPEFEWMPLTKACGHCNGRGWTDEGDPEVGSAVFGCDHCLSTGSSEVAMLKETIKAHIGAPPPPVVPAGGVVQWVKKRPISEGSYKVRGFDDSGTVALVTVLRHSDGELRCNIHERNSDDCIDMWSLVDELSDEFEWCALLSAHHSPHPCDDIYQRKPAADGCASEVK